MVTNSNTKFLNYLINTFNKGMDTDTSDMLIDTESYRMAENLRFITEVDETTGELRLIEGAKELTIDDDIDNTYKILAFNSIQRIGALIVQSTDDWRIYRVELGNGELTLYDIFGPCEDLLNTSVKISTVMKWENEGKLLLYIADGKHKIMKINLFDDTGSKDIKYLTNGFGFFSDSAPVIRGVEYGGKLKPGLVQYAYRLYNDNNVATDISPISRPFAITLQYRNIGGIGMSSNELSSIKLNMTIGIPLEYKQYFPKIELYRVEYTINGQQPNIYLIFDDVYDLDLDDSYGSIFRYSDYGMTTLKTITVESFNSMSGVEIIPSIIELKNGYLFAGNIKYQIEALDEDYLNMDFRAFSTGDNINTSYDTSGNIDWELIEIPENNININLDLHQDYDITKWYSVETLNSSEIGGSGPNILWKLSNTPYDENYEQAIQDFNIQDFNKIDDFISGSIVVDDPNAVLPSAVKIINSSDRFGYPVIKGLRHDEIYRYGIILYSTEGIKYPVKWIADIRTPSLDYTRNADDLQKIVYSDSHSEFKNLLHPVFNVLCEFNTSKIQGYEIVIAQRTSEDIATISQGIIAATAGSIPDYSTSNKLCSIGEPFIDYYLYNDHIYKGGIDLKPAQSKINVLQFYSAETIYQIDDLLDLIGTNKENYYLQAVCPLVPTTSVSSPYEDENFAYFGGNVYTFNTNSYHNSESHYSEKILIITYPSDREDSYSVPESLKHFFAYGISLPSNDCKNFFELYKMYPTIMPDLLDVITIIDPLDPHAEDKDTPICKFEITDIERVYPMKWNEVISNNTFYGMNKISMVGQYEFFSIVAPEFFGGGNIPTLYNPSSGDARYYYLGSHLIATCAPSLVFSFNDLQINDDFSIIKYFHRPAICMGRVGTDLYGEDVWEHRCTKKHCEFGMLCNLRRYVLPYGGFSKYARNLTTYVHGDYYYPANYVQRDIELFNGDTNVSVLEFATSHKYFPDGIFVEGLVPNNINCIICQVAVESSINIELDHGLKFSNISDQDNATMFLIEPSNVDNTFNQERPAYEYNTAYSSRPDVLITRNSESSYEDYKNKYPARVHYSNPAEESQNSDPWLIFQPLNYLDVDGSYGPITDMRTFENKLMFWQKDATGILSVNERVQITDQSNLPLILGTGGVLDRYDYITTENGMRENEHADVQSGGVLYWWDHDNHTICAYTGLKALQLSKLKNVLNWLNRKNKSGELIDTDLDNTQWPLLIYDKRYNEVLFKVTANECLVYNELQGQFSSVYIIDPDAYFNFGAELVLIDKKDNNDLNANLWNSYEDQDDSKDGYMKSVDLKGQPLFPYFKYICNDLNHYTKVFDNAEFAAKLPEEIMEEQTLNKKIKFEFKTPLKQEGKIWGDEITNRQYDFKFAIPRCGYYNDKGTWITKEWGDRMRGKTMQCELSSTSNSLDFSLQYIITKFRISWS